MDRGKHVRIGMAALQQGSLDLSRFAEALLSLGSSPGPRPPEAVWVETGFLSAEQLTLALSTAELPVDLSEQPKSSGDLSESRFERPTQPYLKGPLVAAGGKTAVEKPDPQPAVQPTMASGPGMPMAATSFEIPAAKAQARLLEPSFAPADRYAQVRLLGAGGMGQVFECVDQALGRKVAVKRLLPDFASDPTAMSMLEREARVIGSLEHPNIIPVYDAGFRDDTGPYYAMRLLQRLSLAEVLRRLGEGEPQATSDFGLGRLLRSFIQVCQAVDYAHSRGVIHCDLKPANILLGAFGEVLVVDWGLAHGTADLVAYRGGTPGYMAPEQFDPSSYGIDARTDVYALGGILYEILTLQHAFPEMPAAMLTPEGAGPVSRRPVPPRARAGGRAVPEELEEACMKALELRPEARHPSAHALAEAVEVFLEGTKERERREKRATQLGAQGDDLASSYSELVESRPDRVAEVNSLRVPSTAWSPPEEKQALWDAEDRLAVLDALAIRTFQASVAAYEKALDEVPQHAQARRGLAGLYRAELQRAHERRDDFDRVYFEGLLRQYDAPDAPPGGSGVLSLGTIPESVSVSLGHVEEHGRRLIVVREEPLGPTPVERAQLAAGTYIARLSRPGFFDVLCPFMLRPGQELSWTVDVRGAASVKPGEIFVPGGPALLGGDESNLGGRDLNEVDVPAFFISTFPVSFSEYFEFLRAMIQQDAGSARRFLPVSSNNTPYWEWDGEGFAPAHVSRWGQDRDQLLSLPVFGVDLSSAEAYARWRSANTGRAYRLPTEWEWEKAARGTDGRRYPWGDRFDPSFCKMRESRPSLPHPEPSGTFSPDRSPYGVRDMAGGVSEWVVHPSDGPESGPARVASRGGAWCDWRVDCHLGARRVYFLEERSARVGFRLVRDVNSAPPNAS